MTVPPDVDVRLSPDIRLWVGHQESGLVQKILQLRFTGQGGIKAQRHLFFMLENIDINVFKQLQSNQLLRLVERKKTKENILGPQCFWSAEQTFYNINTIDLCD
jgi:hypothetical protein